MEQRIKAVIYARVSSEEQKKEGFSIPAQLDLLRSFAKQHNIDIVKEFEEAETAKQAGRHQFNEMLKFLKKSKDVKTVLCEKTDRLYRNFKDYVDLDVVTKQDTYSFQIMNNEVVYQMMERIKDYPIEDPLGLVDIYLNKRDMVQFNQYINRHFRKWAKEYHLDNPRDSIIRRYK